MSQRITRSQTADEQKILAHVEELSRRDAAKKTRKSTPRSKKQHDPNTNQRARLSGRIKKSVQSKNTPTRSQGLPTFQENNTTSFLTLRYKRLTAKKQLVSIISSRIRSGRVRKDAAAEPTLSKSLVLLIQTNYHEFEYKVMKSMGIRPKIKNKDYWPYAHHRGFKLGHNPWAHLNWPAPAEAKVREVHQLLADYHKTFEFGTYVSMPAHGAEASTNVDVIIQTIFAQSTGNENAIDTHSRLCNAFPFVVDGEKYVGKMPDWHTIRTLPREELETALKQGGFQMMRAKFIQGVLDHVYKKNVERKKQGVQVYDSEENPPDAKDFVPGMLSMDYLTDSSGDNSDEALLGRLLELPGIGIKSAMCVMAFSLKRPLFVVDTHVLRFCIWLGWIPKDAKENAAAMFLHKHVPDDIKYDLHNQIWTHCANENVRESKTRAVICPFCGSNPPAKGRDVSKHTCPVAAFLLPLAKRWPGRIYRPKVVVEEAVAETQSIDEGPKQEEEGIQMEDVDDYEAQDNVILASTPKDTQTTLTDFFAIEPLTPESSQGDLNNDAGKEDVAEDEDAKPTKGTKLNLARLKSIRFEDVPKEQTTELYEAGFHLWEFRPMDNTFMEEWGTFDRVPRYKWERADIMDKDVAVTWEYANSVLNGNARHKWSKPDEIEVAEEQILSAMAE